MPHSVTCGACKASFSIPDEVWDKRVHGQLATLKCRHCKSPIEVDGRSRKGAAANVATNIAAPVASATEDAPLVQPKTVAAAAPKEPAASAMSATAKGKPAEPKSEERPPAQANKFEQKRAEPKTEERAPTPVRAEVQPTKAIGVQPQGAEVKQPQPALAARKPAMEYASKSAHATTAGSSKVGGLSPAASTAAKAAATSTPTRKSGDNAAFKQPTGSTTATKPAHDPTAKPKSVTVPGEASRGSTNSDLDWDDDESDLWVVGFGIDDDRELTTTQLHDCISKGQLDGEAIVWRDGMSDWLPISKIPELARSLTPKHGKAGAPTVSATSATAGAVASKSAGTRTEDGDDETVIYKPGSKFAAAVATAATEAAEANSASVTNAGGGKIGNAAPSKLEAHSPQPKQPDTKAPRHEVSAKSTLELAAAKANTGGAKAGGGPPPLRRQPSRPDDTGTPIRSATGAAQSESREEVVTSVREYAPTRAAAAPPPLPLAEKKETPAAKPAIFPPAAQTAQAFSPVKVEAAQGPRVTSSFAPRPSDIAALTKIRPKFPKWLPFAVLGGLVLLVAIMAALSWLRGESPDDAERKVVSAVPGPSAPPPTRSTTPAAAQDTPKSNAPADGDLSSGFASKFAQAAAKQRPTARFDRDVAEKALAPAFAKAAGCHNRGEPTGTANVTISLAPSGQVLSVTVAQPFTTTFTAECIRNALRDASVPPFQGSPGRLAHSIRIN